MAAPMLVRGRAAGLRPQGLDFGEHALTELVPGPGEREGDVRVEALQAPVAARAADARIEVGIGGGRSRELVPQRALLGIRALETVGQASVGAHGSRPALDASSRLESRYGCDEVPAREVVRRRKRLPALVVRRLLRHGGKPPGAAADDASKRARRAPELALDGGTIVHAPRS